MNVKKRKTWKWIHKWFSIILGPFFLLWAVSGIVLNHRDFFSSVDVQRKYLPIEYQYNNWNLSAVRGDLRLHDDSLLIFGNIGIWQTDMDFSEFKPLMTGLPEGMDSRRTMAMIMSSSGHMYAGTQSGLYTWHPGLAKWKKIALSASDQRISDLSLKEGKLMVATRSELLLARDTSLIPAFDKVILKPAANDDGKTGLFRTLWVIHSGEIFGMTGKLFVDLLAIALVFFTITGYIYTYFPKWIRQRKNNARKTHTLGTVTKFSVRWHKKLGIWLVAFLIITTITGMFLRPPLLIAIGNVRINKIPFTVLSDNNTWHDKIRAIHWNEQSAYWLIATNDGLYHCDEHFKEPPVAFSSQPPLSVMGINVLEYQQNGTYLIGSFNGLFKWNPETTYIEDAITGEIPQKQTSAASPIGNHLISGMITSTPIPLIFEYNNGLINARVKMPESIASLPIPLWNVALEIHTARIFQSLIGIWYILIIPLFGLASLSVLISGLVVWMRRK